MTELIKCKLEFKPKEWGEKGNEAYFYLFIFLLMKLFMGLSFTYILVANPVHEIILNQLLTCSGLNISLILIIKS